MKGSIGFPRTLRQSATSPWTAERIEYLKTRWSQGAAARQIARELGHGISRNAVLGKIHRLGIVDLSPHGGAGGKRPAAKADRRAPQRPRRHHVGGRHRCEERSLPAWIADAKPYIDDPLLDADIPLSQRRSFLELSDRTCRWPVGDPGNSDFFFCGAEPFRNRPYCAAHCARAYRPEQHATQRAPSARRRRAMLKYLGIDTYIKLGGETAAEWQWAGEGGCATEQDDRI